MSNKHCHANSKFISTDLATDWGAQDSLTIKVLEKLLCLVPNANPGYRKHMHLVHRWLIEFGEDNHPWREVGLSADDEVVVAGPSNRDYGFWCDTNMAYKDFVGDEIIRDEFERYWDLSKGFRGDA